MKIKKVDSKNQHVKYRIFISLNFENCLLTKVTCDNGKIQFQINCASRGFHFYRNMWSPKIGQNLVARQEVGHDQDPQCQLELILQKD